MYVDASCYLVFVCYNIYEQCMKIDEYLPFKYQTEYGLKAIQC